jgi:hypothetical protein
MVWDMFTTFDYSIHLEGRPVSSYPPDHPLRQNFFFFNDLKPLQGIRFITKSFIWLSGVNYFMAASLFLNALTNLFFRKNAHQSNMFR